MSRKFLLFIIIFLLTSLIITACGAAAPSALDRGETSSIQTDSAGMAPSEESKNSLVSADEYATGQSSERIVIRTANMTLVVSEPPESMERIKKLADELGGYVVAANLSQTALENGVKVPQASVTLRVPAEKLDEAITRIRGESDQLPLSETINSQDVTSEYTDLQSRLRNLENTEAQLVQIQEEAVKTEDVLNVYNQIVQVREQIELIKGQIQYYEQSSKLSSVSVELLANEAVQPLTIGGWQPGGVAKSALQALINFAKGFVNFLLWLVIFILPVLLVLFAIFVLPVLLIIWAIRRKKRANKKPPVTPPQA